ncbi:MAG: fasciclin domain-containing protein [Gemmatimonadales bacterium]|nr:fasciclin domain-containing protein [Gemmatimonadales bacterium]
MMRRSLALLVLLGASAAHAQAPKPVLDRLREMDGYGQFVQALETAGLATELAGNGPFTVYAVSDAGMARIPADTLTALTADAARFRRVMGHHVLPMRLDGMGMMNLPIYARVPTAAGDSMVVYHDKGGIKVDLSLVKTADLEASNGVIHTVHKLILVP